MLTRRGFLGFLAAPAIVRASSLMPVRAFVDYVPRKFVVSGVDQFGLPITEYITIPQSLAGVYSHQMVVPIKRSTISFAEV